MKKNNIDTIENFSNIFNKLASKTIKKMATKDFIIVPAGTPLYHGSIEPFASKIESDGFLRSDMWSMSDTSGKVSGGTMDEIGLIWFSTSKEDAEGFARGEEAYRKGREVIPGKVFVYRPNKNLKLVNRNAPLTKKDAEILQAVNPRPYDPIRPGMSLSLASSKMTQHSTDYKTLKDIFKLLKFDGMVYGRMHYAIMAEKLPVSESYLIENKNEIKEPIQEPVTDSADKNIDEESIEPNTTYSLNKMDEIDSNLKDILELIEEINKRKFSQK